jgi:hypothetical protein
MLSKILALSSALILTFAVAERSPAADAAKAAEWPSPVTWKPDPRAVKSGLYIEPQTAATKQTVTFTVSEPDGIARKSWPVRGGIPLFRGELADPSMVRLLDAKGNPVPVQAIATAFWPEKTVRFLCLDFVTDLAAKETASFTLEYGSMVPKVDSKVMVKSEQAGACEIATTHGTYAFKSAANFLEVRLDKTKRTIGPITSELKVAKDDKGGNPTTMPLNVERIEISERGPVQCTVHVVGHFGDQKTAFSKWTIPEGYLKSFRGAPMHNDYWRYPVSLHFRIYRGSDQVYLEHCFGYNGDEFSDFVQSYALKIATGLKDGTFAYGPDDKAQSTSALGVRLNQFANDKWTLTGKATAEGKRFGGWAAITGGGSTVFAALREAWQNWPVAVRAEANGDLVYEIFGDKPDSALDLRYFNPDGTFHQSHSMYNGYKLGTYYTNTDANGRAAGLRKIHEMVLSFAGEGQNHSEIARASHKQLVPWAGQKRFKDTRAMGLISVYENERWAHMNQYYKAFLALMPLLHETNNFYGWVDWGDVPMVDAAKEGKFVLDFDGAYGWSNGERGLCTYFYQYVASGDRFFLDTGRSMVHHTIGIDAEHEGGDFPHGSYARHDQVHWREWDPEECRQGGYRGWHNYAWLTGDPEVRSLMISAGSDAASNRRNMDVSDPDKSSFKVGGNMTANQQLAHWCWVSTGDWRYARAHHAVAQLSEYYCSLAQGIPYMTEFHANNKGELMEAGAMPASGPGSQQGYWYTYGGDDLLLDWTMLTGDPAAVGALLQESRQTVPGIGNFAIYHQPEAMLVAIAYLEPTNPGLPGALQHRLGLIPGLHYWEKDKRKSPERFANAQEWDGYNAYQYGKNGWSIYGCMAQESLHILAALEHLESKPKPILSIPLLQIPAIVHARDDKDTALLEIDGTKTVGTPEEIAEYAWSVNGKQVATGAQAKLEVPIGPAIIGVQLTTKDGMKLQSQAAINVLASGEWKYSFGAGAKGFLDGHRRYDAVGYGWSADNPANAYETNPPYQDPEHGQGCGFLLIWRTTDFVIKMPAPGGNYSLEMGAAVKSDYGPFRGPASVNGVAIQTPNVSKTGNYLWEYKGDVKADANGEIRISFVRDDARFAVAGYVIVRKKK